MIAPSEYNMLLLLEILFANSSNTDQWDCSTDNKRKTANEKKFKSKFTFSFIVLSALCWLLCGNKSQYFIHVNQCLFKQHMLNNMYDVWRLWRRIASNQENRELLISFPYFFTWNLKYLKNTRLYFAVHSNGSQVKPSEAKWNK